MPLAKFQNTWTECKNTWTECKKRIWTFNIQKFNDKWFYSQYDKIYELFNNKFNNIHKVKTMRNNEEIFEAEYKERHTMFIKHRTDIIKMSITY